MTFSISFPFPVGSEVAELCCTATVTASDLPQISNTTEWKFNNVIEVAFNPKKILKIVVQDKDKRKEFNEDEPILDYCEDCICRWIETANMRKRGQIQKKSRLIADWMNHQYLTTSALYNPIGNTVNDWRVYDFICSYIAKSIRADVCHLYRYTPHESKYDLSTLGISASTEYWTHLDLEDVVGHMEKLSRNKGVSFREKAEQSVVYRSISNGCTAASYKNSIVELHGVACLTNALNLEP